MKLTSFPLSLRQLQYVVAVAEMRNFRRAAEQCHVSQPSLSAQVAQLEEVLGVTLFERSKRQVLLTSAGQELVGRARRVLLDAEDFLEAARRLGNPLSGTLRLGVIPTISPYLLPFAQPVLRKSYPELAVRWVEDKTDVLMALLRKGDIDAALLALEADIGDVEHAVIAEDPFVLATPPEHPLARKRAPARPEELEGEQVLLLDDGHCFREQTLHYCADAGIEELGFRATSLSTLAQMVASGSGVTLLPRLAVPTEVARGMLALRPFAEPAPHRTLALVWRPHSPLAEALREVAATVTRAYRAAEPRMIRAITRNKPGRASAA